MLLSILSVATGYTAQLKGKDAERIIVEGKLLKIDYEDNYYSLLIIHKKKVYNCVSYRVGNFREVLEISCSYLD